MKQAVKRWVMPTLRYALLAAAVAYLVITVPWHDRITLEDGEQRVRLLEERRDESGNATAYVIERDGQPVTITPDEVQTKDGVPVIKHGISDVVRRMRFDTALLAVLIFLPVPILQSIRLVWMIAVQEVRLSYWNAIKLSFAGNFFNFALPGFFGGDMIKAYYITRFTHRKTEAVTTVFLDRIVGLSGLMIVASVTFLLAWNRMEWDPGYRATLTSAFAAIWGGLAVACAFLFSRRLRHLIRLPQLAERLPAAGQLLRIGRATVLMRHRKRLVAAALLNTIVLQLLVVVAAYQMSRALDMRGDFTLYFIFVPIGFLIAAIPILPPNAIGVMEWAYVQFFTLGGLNPASAAVAFALANRLTQLVWALPGVLVPLLGAHLPSHRELEELERTARPEPPENDHPDDARAAKLASNE